MGVLCVEFFVLADDSLVVNEMAPRPHNSGHYSIDACDLSQFDLQVRTLAGLPLVQPRQHSPAIMLNVLGDLWVNGKTPPWHQVLALPGELLGLPTETVYGLAADADNAQAIAKIFHAKGRPSDHPLIVHVLNEASVVHFAGPVPDFAHALMQAFWPGPLTLILPRRPGVAGAAAGGQNSIGLRCPSHPVAQALLLACQATVDEAGEPVVPVWGVAAPSANQFGRVSPTTAQHVQGEFGADLLILDGGPCDVGIESTIIDCTRGVPVLLRPGAITPEQVQLACGLTVRLPGEMLAPDAPAPRASGTLESHYAPRAKVRLMDAPALQQALDVLGRELDQTQGRTPDGPSIAVYARAPLKSRSAQVLIRRMPDDASATAQQLFAVLREFDAQGVKLIWIETPPDAPEWDGVRDRLQRASAD